MNKGNYGEYRARLEAALVELREADLEWNHAKYMVDAAWVRRVKAESQVLRIREEYDAD